MKGFSYIYIYIYIYIYKIKLNNLKVQFLLNIFIVLREKIIVFSYFFPIKICIESNNKYFFCYSNKYYFNLKFLIKIYIN